MGAWIEIELWLVVSPDTYGRTPRWVRGLKSGALVNYNSNEFVAPHDGCVDWNIGTEIPLGIMRESHPTMGAWIEISL